MVTKVRVQAAGYGTFAGKHGDIYHFNPDGSDQNARYPLMHPDDLDRAKLDGLIAEEVDAAKLAQVKAQDDPTSMESFWQQIMAKQTAMAAEMEDDAGLNATPAGGSSSPLTSAATTAYPTGAPANINSGIAAIGPDAPPAPVAAGIADLSVAKLTDAIADETDVAKLDALRAQEAAKPNPRSGALAAIDDRIAALSNG